MAGRRIPNMEYENTICSEEFVLSETMNRYYSLLDDTSSNSEVAGIGDLTQEEMEILSTECSIDSLQDPDGQPTVYGNTFADMKNSFTAKFPIHEKYDHLKTVQNLRKRIASNQNARASKYYNGIRLAQIRKGLPGLEITSKKECIITIRAYNPFVASCHHTASNKKMKTDRIPYNAGPKLSFEVSVLGRQCLTELRDVFMCRKNGYSGQEISDTPNAPPDFNEIPGNSGFFFINNVFYNDFRTAGSSDISQVIRDWAKTQSLAPELKTASMSETTFNDLKIRVGAPNVYQHHGCCEHLFVFSDVHVADAAVDSLSVLDYPMMRTLMNEKLEFCTICRLFPAKKLTKQHSRVPQYETCLWCDDCFMSFNYVDGKKQGSFKAYHYSQKCCKRWLNRHLAEANPQPNVKRQASATVTKAEDTSQ